MKKILSILTIVMLVCSLCIPAFAAEDDYPVELLGAIYTATEYVTYNGYTVPDVSVLPHKYHLLYLNDAGEVMATSADKDPAIYADGMVTITSSYAASAYAVKGYEHFDLSWECVISNTGPDEVLTIPADKVVWTDHDILAADGSVWMAGPSCDGTTCPATDANQDGVCDDCGLAFSFRSLGSFEVVVDHAEDLTIRYVYNATVAGTTFDALYTDNRIIVTFSERVSHEQYKLVDGVWEYLSSDNVLYDSHEIGFTAGSKVLASDFDILDENGEVFFSLPLWEKAQNQWGTAVTATMETEVPRAMIVITLCGVGCLALLVALPLFGKVLRRFLS